MIRASLLLEEIASAVNFVKGLIGTGDGSKVADQSACDTQWLEKLKNCRNFYYR
jgi:hypothetical protein